MRLQSWYSRTIAHHVHGEETPFIPQLVLPNIRRPIETDSCELFGTILGVYQDFE